MSIANAKDASQTTGRTTKTASLYRMVTDEHICPFGLKAKDLLERKGFEVEDHLLENREQQMPSKTSMTLKPRRKLSSMGHALAAMMI